MRQSTRNRSFASGANPGGPQSDGLNENGAKKADLLKDFEAAGWPKDKELSLPQLVGYIETRLRDITLNPQYKMLDEEKRAVEKLFSSLDKNSDGRVAVYLP